MTDLETSMATIIAVFQKYSEREGDKHKLKKNELKDLLHDELPDLMAVRRNCLKSLHQLKQNHSDRKGQNRSATPLSKSLGKWKCTSVMDGLLDRLTGPVLQYEVGKPKN